jgi:hypothetical protein
MTNKNKKLEEVVDTNAVTTEIPESVDQINVTTDAVEEKASTEESAKIEESAKTEESASSENTDEIEAADIDTENNQVAQSLIKQYGYNEVFLSVNDGYWFSKKDLADAHKQKTGSEYKTFKK